MKLIEARSADLIVPPRLRPAEATRVLLVRPVDRDGRGRRIKRQWHHVCRGRRMGEILVHARAGDMILELPADPYWMRPKPLIEVIR